MGVAADDISLQDLSLNSDEHTTAYKGAKQLFLGDRHSTEGVPRRSGKQPRSSMSDTETVALENDLMNPQQLDVIRAGLKEALGKDGQGAWLADTSKAAPSIAPSLSPLASPVHSVYRRSKDALGVAEEGLGVNEQGYLSQSTLGVPGRDHAGGSGSSPKSTAKHLSTMMRSFSSRVAQSRQEPNDSPLPSPSLTDVSYLSYSPFASSTNLASVDTSYRPHFEELPRYPSPIQVGLERRPQHPQQLDESDECLVGSGHEYDPEYRVFELNLEEEEELFETMTVTTAGDTTGHAIYLPPPPKLVGKSLKVFDQNSVARRRCNEIVSSSWIEPLLVICIVLETVLLSYITAPNIFGEHPDGELFLPWGKSWTDWTMLAIFIIYSCEIVVKVIAYGLWDDSQLIPAHQRVPRWKKFKQRLRRDKFVEVSGDGTGPSDPAPLQRSMPVILRTFTSLAVNDSKTKHIIRAKRAYLRSSWNRVDFASVIAFWISLGLNVSGVENNHTFFAFRVVAHLRILRLLNLTSGTASVLRSIKKAGPLLTNIALFIGFFWMIFSIIGVQSFKSSLRRTCVWVDKEGIQPNYTTQQFCGSYLNADTYEVEPYIFSDGTKGAKAKGFTCPANSYCVSDTNPYGNTLSFDNVFNSLEIVFVIMSANTFTDIMYYTTETDYLVSALFFIAGIVVLYIWLMNLVVAVIASSFTLVREELMLHKKEESILNSLFGKFKRRGKHGAYDGHHLEYLTRTSIGKAYQFLGFIWPLIIWADIIVQCTLTSANRESQSQFIYKWQIFTTSALAAEIVARFLLYLPDWRQFLSSKSNVIDTVLAIVTVIIILPPIHKHEEVYAWLTFFQLARFYRVVVSVPFARDMWAKVLGNYRTIFNLTVFLFLLTYLCALLASLLYRGAVPYEDEGTVNEVSFFDLANSFVGLYVVTSTENWTTMLYLSVQYASNKLVAITFGAFLIGWYIFSNFIVLNLFVAIITENLEITPEEKRKGQIRLFIKEYAQKMNFQSDYMATGVKLVKGIFQRTIGKGSKEASNVQNADDVFDLLLERQVVEGFLVEGQDEPDDSEVVSKETAKKSFQERYNPATVLKKTKDSFFRFAKLKKMHENPFTDTQELLSVGNDTTSHPITMAQEYLSNQTNIQERRERYLQKNPNYDRSIYLFPQGNKLRRMCQNLVASSYGIRQAGAANPKPMVWNVFTGFMLVSTIGLVVTACINTPVYVFVEYGKIESDMSKLNWITFVDGVFVVVFTFEAFIKIVADGFFFTPNGYLRSDWNRIDFFVLLSLWINFCSEAFYNAYISRFVRCFEALRALRLLSITSTAQETFHSVIIVGFRKIIGAALISLCLLFPYSVWGLNIFNGKLNYCTDGSVGNFGDCVDEYLSSPFNWDLLAPRAVAKTYYDYDSFGHAFLVQFEIISLEGWVDVLNSVMAITGRDSNPEPFASRYNGIFSILYNILGTIFILTLFISVIIQNYSENRGTAYLTEEQLSWYETVKGLKIVKPKRRPPQRKPGTIRHYLLRKSLDKNSWIQWAEISMLLLIVLLLCLEYYPAPDVAEVVISSVILAVTGVYELLLFAKMYALGRRHFFRHLWQAYAFVITTASLIITFVGRAFSMPEFFYIIEKLPLVGMLLLWIPKSERLDQLFKTASASFTHIGNLLITWFIMFLMYGIAFTQVFGLTRIGQYGGVNANFRTVPKAFLLLFRMSFGEGWNEILNDYLVSPPNCAVATTKDGTTDDGDCGNHAYAYILFISWNILSMYIFVNMFISLIFENFSYIFHRNNELDITKNDIRKFKDAWVEFDPRGTGYIRTEDLTKLLRRAEGYFSLRIYEGKHTVPAILERSLARTGDIYRVDVPALNSVIREISGPHYRRKRQIYDMFCTQALIEATDKGISFTTLMLQFPFYKTLDENRCLKLDDYLKRKMLRRQIEVEMLKSRMVGFLEMIYLNKKAKARMSSNVPIINITPNFAFDDGRPKTPEEEDRGRSLILGQSPTTRTSSAQQHLTIKNTSPRRKRGPSY
ncbi:calcium-channel protein Cch1p [Trichomonascus vanleenenianus]|uniref:calcium channel protein CCH1 n=1 Tax=Trichomonascus vanleenenianus TaxID=2268995 RepID=UPI003EC9C449